MKVKCCDGVFLELEEALVYASSTVRKLIGEDIASRGCLSVCLFGSSQGENREISFAEEISSKTLLKINEYVKKHADAAAGTSSDHRISNSLRSWDLEFIKVDCHTLIDLVLAAKYLKIKDLLDLSCQTVMAKNDMTLEEEEEYQRPTIGIEKGKNIISEEVIGQQCGMEERGEVRRVNLIHGGSSEWSNVAATGLKLHLENMSVKRLSDLQVAKLAKDYKACMIQQCLATVVMPMKNIMRHKIGCVQTITNLNKEEQVMFTKCDRFVKAARGGRRRKRNGRWRENQEKESF